MLGLRWQDISDDHSVAQVKRTIQRTREGVVVEDPKTPRSKRSVLLPSFLKPYLLRQIADRNLRRKLLGDDWSGSGYVVDRGDGSCWNPGVFCSAWRAFLNRAGLPHVRFHDLRHAHATLMLQQGVHPKIVSERLGHSSVGITLDTYSHVLPAMQQQAAEAFDELFANSAGLGTH